MLARAHPPYGEVAGAILTAELNRPQLRVVTSD
jgi:hypothetical protein